MYSSTFGKGWVGRSRLYFLVRVSFGSFSLRELTCMHCVYLALWTLKVLRGSFLCATYKFSFIHSFRCTVIFFHKQVVVSYSLCLCCLTLIYPCNVTVSVKNCAKALKTLPRSIFHLGTISGIQFCIVFYFHVQFRGLISSTPKCSK